jgi:hypothetical protein
MYQSIGLNEVMIQNTAIIHGMRLAKRVARDFAVIIIVVNCAYTFAVPQSVSDNTDGLR